MIQDDPEHDCAKRHNHISVACGEQFAGLLHPRFGNSRQGKNRRNQQRIADRIIPCLRCPVEQFTGNPEISSFIRQPNLDTVSEIEPRCEKKLFQKYNQVHGKNKPPGTASPAMRKWFPENPAAENKSQQQPQKRRHRNRQMAFLRKRKNFCFTVDDKQIGRRPDLLSVFHPNPVEIQNVFRGKPVPVVEFPREIRYTFPFQYPIGSGLLCHAKLSGVRRSAVKTGCFIQQVNIPVAERLIKRSQEQRSKKKKRGENQEQCPFLPSAFISVRH